MAAVRESFWTRGRIVFLLMVLRPIVSTFLVAWITITREDFLLKFLVFIMALVANQYCIVVTLLVAHWHLLRFFEWARYHYRTTDFRPELEVLFLFLGLVWMAGMLYLISDVQSRVWLN